MNEYYCRKSDGRRGETRNEYSVAIVQETYYDGYYCGRATFNAGPIRFCPGCGRKIGNEQNTFEKEKDHE